jgi:hypothetical protein
MTTDEPGATRNKHSVSHGGSSRAGKLARVEVEDEAA